MEILMCYDTDTSSGLGEVLTHIKQYSTSPQWSEVEIVGDETKAVIPRWYELHHRRLTEWMFVRKGTPKMTKLNAELDFFNQIESNLVSQGFKGDYVAIRGKDILARGPNPGYIINNLLEKYSNTLPEPLLIRRVLGEKRQPVRMRSPRVARASRG